MDMCHTCLLKSSACGARACGSASFTKRITSSIDQVEGSLFNILEGSLFSEFRSGPVVELAAFRIKNIVKGRSITSLYRENTFHFT